MQGLFQSLYALLGRIASRLLVLSRFATEKFVWGSALLYERKDRTQKLCGREVYCLNGVDQKFAVKLAELFGETM